MGWISKGSLVGMIANAIPWVVGVSAEIGIRFSETKKPARKSGL
jgi:hypothetical protein